MEEVVDVVDKDDARIGTATRKSVHSSGAWHRGAHVLVFDRDGDLLLQRRSMSKDKAPGALDLSVSEHSKAGESFEETARRGLSEELGIAGLELTPVVKFRMEYGPKDNMVSVLYRANFEGELSPDSSEVEALERVGNRRLVRLVAGEELAPWARELLRWNLGLSSSVEEIPWGTSAARGGRWGGKGKQQRKAGKPRGVRRGDTSLSR